ncbi:MAG: hypothetical protein ABSE96_21630 [Terracidiphilus sp.]|jgi:ribonuclease HI
MSASEYLLRCVSSERFIWREQGWPKWNYLADLGQRLDEAGEKHIIKTELIGIQGGDPDKQRCDDIALSQAEPTSSEWDGIIASL